ncbi:MAG TPA: amidohydrolase family protein [Candidatus Limnocylindria bacterium]|jgi:L-fuconolactonase|nr:amidohydrolase family protein [Candidatus Limnocylindria bacterium]
MVVIDAHHHFWDPARRTYPWMTGDLAPIRRRFGPEDLRPLLALNRVDRTILVQTVSRLDETREFLATAAQHDFIAGVVGWVDLTAPDVAERIAELRSGAGGPKLVGIRHQVHDEADAEWLLRADVRRGLTAVGEADLAYDILVRTRELPAALATVRDFPDMRFVIDHIAKPPIALAEIDEWAARLKPVASHPNVFCKLSGMVTEADWDRWTTTDLTPYVSRVLDWFGPDRCVFGSDWPVCLLAAPYPRVLQACRQAVGDLTSAERDRVFGENAVELYRIPVAAAAKGRP